MDVFIPQLPEGQALVVFLVCLAVGAFTIIKYCLDQFDKPIASPDDKTPWKFVVPSYLTPRQQYLTGFAIYCSSILLIFFAVSIVVGPGNFFFILKAVAAAVTEKDFPTAETLQENNLEAYPAFPILVAFYIVGLNPNLPATLNFEEPLRRLAWRLAYIPKNMDRIFNYMRFSQFDLAEERLAEAYAAVQLRRPDDGPELKAILPAFNRTVMLYARAGALADELDLPSASHLSQYVDLDVFRQYRGEIENVGINLKGIAASLVDAIQLSAGDRARSLATAQRDLNRILEILYVIFACASTVQDTGRMSDRLRAIGFTSPMPSQSPIPWDPVLRVVGAAAIVLFIAYETGAHFPVQNRNQLQIPPTAGGILKFLAVILFIHAFAIGQALNRRAHLIATDLYFDETGRGSAIAYGRIALRCWFISALWYLALNLDQLITILLHRPDEARSSYAALAVLGYVRTYLIWAVVPAICGALSALVIDRPSDKLQDRALSAALQALGMGIAAVIVVEMSQDDPPLVLRLFSLGIYGGLGGIVGFLLPAALRRYWRAQDDQFPEQINLLRDAVRGYFHDEQQFSEWINSVQPALNQRRPVDVLAEQDGLQRLTSFVTGTRRRVPVANG